MYYTYCITNRSRTIYVGVTNNIYRRTHEHQTHYYPESFTARYHCYYLVYYECFEYAVDASAREIQLEHWSRGKKIWLIEKTNLFWLDLSVGW